MLQAETIVAGYEPDLPIVNGASLAVGPGEILAVLGPNGAGKSTLIKAIAGLVPISRGTVRLNGHDISRMPAHERLGRGLAFVPQTENVFGTMTVHDNLRLAADALPDRRQAGSRIGVLFDMFPDLARQRSLLAARLSGGQRQMLAVARALIGRPQVLMLDEPSAGLSPKLVVQVFQQLRQIRADGVGVVLVEQNVRAALAVANRAVVLVEGCDRYQGPAQTLAGDPTLAALYLGARPTAVAL